MAASKRELTAWRDKGYDELMSRPDGEPHPPAESKARAAYYEGRRGARKALENGDGAVSAQRDRRPRVA